MNPSKICGHRTLILPVALLALAGANVLCAAADAGTTSNSAAAVSNGQSQTDEIARLKATLAEQQKQLQMLQQTLQSQQALLDKALGSQSGTSGASTTPAGTFNSVGQVASTSRIIPVAPLPVAYPTPIAAPLPQAKSGAGGNPCSGPYGGDIPPYLRLGNVCIVPVGFMDLTPFWRDKNAASSMGSNFGSVPYNNGAAGNLSEFHFSEQNSRVGFRIDGDWKGAHFIGYNEFDFNGTSGATNLAVSNGAIVPRLRLFWVDVRKSKIEFLGGQSWSMMVPNRRGISALPGDLFYSQVIDINYIAGLTWTRQPGMRILYHPNDKVTFGFSAEQGDQYMGGSGGGGQIVLPTGLAGLVATQLDNGAGFSSSPAGSYLGQPTLTPDFIAKVAFDPSSRFHFEITGIESNFKTASLAAPWTHHTTTGGGVEVGANVELVKNLRAIANGFYSDGEGRYLFGAAPDLVVRADGSLSALHADSWIGGFEANVRNTLLYTYYSGDYIGRNTAIDTNGSLIGYGYKGSANSQNRDIQEITFGFNQTMWKNPRYGAINVMGQYEWLERMPWYVAAGAPKNTHDNTIYFDLRYTLPGSTPNF
ncbi:MAG TPA: hypothetical protein VHY84_00845 [Bryobacteraceae bacterium]|jgi:hypothetical protein|nr:hypothetical protein [Bryobacteraceae bacterium]